MPVVSVSKTISRAGVRVASINMSDVHFPPDPALESGTPIIGLESRVFLAGKRPHKRLYFSKGARLAAACRDDHVGASPLFGIRHLFCEAGGDLLRRHVRPRHPPPALHVTGPVHPPHHTDTPSPPPSEPS